jgi:ABC-type polysaccharide/polyol phosphate transport system ATPase subunit
VSPVVSLRGVGKRYVKYDDAPMLLTAALRSRTRRSHLWALRDVELEIAAGERVGVIGRNGAGKSTLLQLLAGVTAPTEGVVRVDGRVAPLISVGVGFHPELTGRENVYVNGTVLGMTRKQVDARFDDIVDFAEVGDFLDTPVKYYSSGMYVRLGFAVAVQAEPDVLVVDEVLAVGDLAFQMKCADRMAQVADAGATVVLVSHNLGAVRALCPRSVLVDGGGVVADGATGEVVAAYHERLQAPTDSDAASGAPQVSALRLLRPDGSPATRVRTGDELVVAYQARFPTGARGVVPGIAVLAEDGGLVYTDSALWEPVAEVAPGEVLHCQVRLQAHLPTGTWSVVAGVATGAYAGAPGTRSGSATGAATTSSRPLLFYVDGRDTVSGRTDLGGRFSVTSERP